MNRQAYQTTAGQVIQYNFSNLHATHERGDAPRYFKEIPPIGEEVLNYIRLIDKSSFNISPFDHPIVIDNGKERHNSREVYIDTRRMSRRDKNNELIITDYDAFLLQMIRAGLTFSFSLEDGPSRLRTLGPLPIRLYSNTLSSNICDRLGIRDGDDRYLVRNLSAIFYARQFSDEKDFSDENYVRRTCKYVEENAGILYSDISETIDKLKASDNKFSNLNDFIAAIKELSENIRLKDINLALIYNWMAASWFSRSINCAELMGVALEHPPTWLAICYMATNGRSYRSTPIFRTLSTISSPQDTLRFTTAISSILR